jgi:hypothetical protein
MSSARSFKDRHKRFFAVTSLGKNRWYWVVWPSLAIIQSQATGEHLADGYEPSKAEAVDRALAVAGLDGEWVAAKYAKQYHRHRTRRNQSRDASSPAPAVLEFLYRDLQDPVTNAWHSVPHRVVKKTRQYVYVEQRPHDPAQLTGSWLDHNAPTFRLSRAMLEQEGYALTPVTEIDDPLFFMTPYQERLVQFSDQSPACLTLLGLSLPCTIAEVKAAYRKRVKQFHPDHGGSHEEFLTLQTAYEEALRLCRYHPY